MSNTQYLFSVTFAICFGPKMSYHRIYYLLYHYTVGHDLSYVCFYEYTVLSQPKKSGRIGNEWDKLPFVLIIFD